MRAIKSRLSAVTAGAGKSEATFVDNIWSKRNRENGPAVGERAKKRRAGAGVVAIKREREEHELKSNVSRLTQAVGLFV